VLGEGLVHDGRGRAGRRRQHPSAAGRVPLRHPAIAPTSRPNASCVGRIWEVRCCFSESDATLGRQWDAPASPS
jgi:hypothetical protein